jgi:serine/threonine-protein kinase
MPRTTAMPQQQQQMAPQRGGGSGMYALIGFLALIALVAGGIVLFNVLAKNNEPAESFALPEVVGATLEDGSKVLTDLGLQVNPIIDETLTVPEGTIGRTDPVAGVTVQRGQTIDLYYNPVSTPFALPEVSGSTQQEAADLLGGQGLIVDPVVVTENNPDFEAGKVIRTLPPAGTMVKQGDMVQLVVSAGPNQVVVPPVDNLTEAAARALLEGPDYAFVVNVVPQPDATIPAGTALRTDPPATSPVDKGSAITLFVSSGPAPVAVPVLEGLLQATAEQRLRDLGLAPDVTFINVASGDSNDGRVITQSIAAGTPVAPGTIVRLRVGRAVVPPTTTAPPTTTTTTPPATTTTTVPTT